MAGPPSRDDVDSMISSALAEYDQAVADEWARIRIEPEKWRCSPWGDGSGGFWAVAADGDRVLWFNDIEDGFNWSPYSSRGTIGEYLCNQTAFTEILEMIAQAQSELVRAKLRESDVPAEIAGRGTIVRRQTTYWEVRAAQAMYRIHFRDKVEVAFATADYPRLELTAVHPLLVQYDEPSRSLYFSGMPFNSRAVAESLDRTIRDSTHAWRSLADYAGNVDDVDRRLRGGHGLLMSAPGSICAVVARALDAAGVATSVVGSAPARTGMRVLLLGRSYVIAGAFSFERRNGRPGDAT